MTPKPAAPPLHADQIPADLKALPAWVLWNYVWDAEHRKWTNVPYCPLAPTRKASTKDATTWGDYETALAAVEDGKADGLGICAHQHNGHRLVITDLDAAITDDGALTPWAARIVGDLPSYWEVSPSGRGLRGLAWGTLPKGPRKKGSHDTGEIAFYDAGRYGTLTGQHWPGTPTTVEPCTAQLAAVHAWAFPPKVNGTTRQTTQAAPDLSVDDAALLERARAATNGAKFAELEAGGDSTYASPSEADLAFCILLAFWTNKDASRIDRLFRASRRMRDKWLRDRYASETIARAIDYCTEVYTPHHDSAGPAREAPRPEAPPTDDTPRRSRFRAAADVMTDTPPTAVVDDLAWLGCVTTMVAAANIGKTFVMGSIAAAISQRRAWLHRHTRPGSVAYVSYEGDALGLRLKAIVQETGAPLDHVYVLRPEAPLSPTLTRDGVEAPSVGELRLADDLTLLSAELAAAGQPPLVLLVIDTIRASMVGNEDSSDNAAAYLRAVRRLLATVPTAAALLAHHTGWLDGDQPKKRERGSSTWRGNVDATVFLDVADSTDPAAVRLTMETLKVRDGQKPLPLHLVRRRVTLPELDQWGRPYTSCVIDPDPRSHQEREAEAEEAAARATRDVDLKVLHLIESHPSVATAAYKIRKALGLAKETVDDSLTRLELRKHITQARQRQPYTLTDSGREMLARGGNL